MANDHTYDCQQCGAHFDSREQLDRHNTQQHSQQAGSSSHGSSNVSSSDRGGSTRSLSNGPQRAKSAVVTSNRFAVWNAVRSASPFDAAFE